jgi:hypothetical protein
MLWTSGKSAGGGQRRRDILNGAGPAGQPLLLLHRQQLAPRLLNSGAAVNIVSDSIPIDRAWKRVAKILCPGEPVTEITERDAWLINSYRSPADVSDWWTPGMPVAAPPELRAEVDRAYFRFSLQQRIEAWFEDEGFDLSKASLPRNTFEVRIKSAKQPKLQRPISLNQVKHFIREYLASTERPTLTDARNKWGQAHGSSNRSALDEEYRTQAELAGISLKPGPRPSNSAKS